MGGEVARFSWQALAAITQFVELGLCHRSQLLKLAQRIAPLLCHPGHGTQLAFKGVTGYEGGGAAEADRWKRTMDVAVGADS